jgi:2-methylcitrate dehydratase PrpD
MTTSTPADLTGRLAAFIAQRNPEYPETVRMAAKHRILDALAAIISGSTLEAGELSLQYGKSVGGPPEAQLMTTNVLTSVANAALVNGMLAHCDETDDFEPVTKAHPGCSVVPAAWAMAERENTGGNTLIAAVVAGYDICVRVLRAMDPDGLRASHRSVEGIGATFGSSAAAAVVAGLRETPSRHVLSYAAQQASGVWSWVRDREHVEKAFDFGGMGARNGVYAATLVQAGCTGVHDVFEGEHNVLDAFSANPRPHELVEGLGERFFVAETAIKTYSVGYPIQSALDALMTLIRKHRFTADDVQELVARLPEDGAGVVNNRSMPDINIQHMLSVALIDGEVTFASSHSHERMHDPEVLAVKSRVRLQPEPSMVNPEARRQAAIDVTLKDGRTLTHHTLHAPGTMQNPLDTDGVNAKARDLIRDVLGQDRTERLIRAVNDLESVRNIRELRPLLQR